MCRQRNAVDYSPLMSMLPTGKPGLVEYLVLGGMIVAIILISVLFLGPIVSVIRS